MRAPGWHQLDTSFPDRATTVVIAAHELLPGLKGANGKGRLQD